MGVTALDSELAGLLTAYEVVATVKGDVVLLPQLGTWADLRMYETAAGGFVMEVRTAVPGGPVLLDTWAAWGSRLEDARRDGLRAFCDGTFHVLLGAIWGVLESDQVTHELRSVAGQEWDVYLGGFFLRRSADGSALRPPADLADAVLRVLEPRMVGTGAHVIRVYRAFHNGASLRTEGLWDGESFPELEALIEATDWDPGSTGFTSARWLLAVRAREGGRPSHTLERTCG